MSRLLIIGSLFCCQIGVCTGKIITVGPALKNRKHTDMLFDKAVIPKPHSPVKLDGKYHVSLFRFFAKKRGKIQLQLWHQIGNNRKYRLQATTGEYDVKNLGIHNVTPSSTMTIRDGDVIGYYTPGYGVIPYDEDACGENRSICLMFPSSEQRRVGAISQFIVSPFVPCLTYSLQVIINVTSETPKFKTPMLAQMLWVQTAKDLLVLSEESSFVETSGRGTCAITCQQVSGCKSFTFAGLDNKCWLNNYVLNHTAHGYHPQTKAEYYIPRDKFD